MRAPAVGDDIPEWRLDVVSGDKMKLLAAILRDPNPIHFDRNEAKLRTGQARTINQGPINVAYITNMLMSWTGPRSLRSLRVRFTSNVFEGDTVRAAGVVTAVRPGNGETLVDCDVWLERSDRTKVVVGTATVTIARNSSERGARRLGVQS